jgi:hypothetical protein
MLKFPIFLIVCISIQFFISETDGFVIEVDKDRLRKFIIAVVVVAKVSVAADAAVVAKCFLLSVVNVWHYTYTYIRSL